MSDLPESRLSPLVIAWLKERGLKPASEVPFYGGAIDLVGWREGLIEAVELKSHWNRRGLYQASTYKSVAHRSWLAVPNRPRASSLAEAEKRGVGILMARQEAVIVLVEAPTKEPWAPHVERMLGMIRDWPEATIAGLPSLNGCGPAQEVQRAVEEHRRAHPKATWHDLYEAIPNHYTSAKSMAGAMRMNQERLRFRALRKRRKMGKAP